MQTWTLNIHHEGVNLKNFPNGDVSYYFREILDNNLPVAISPSLHNYKTRQWDSREGREALELIKEIVKRPNSILGQQGYTHKCKYNHTFADPWHEFYCLWGKRISKEEQREWMKRGRDELEKLIGVTPELCSPPNHYFDRTTLDVAESLGYKYFSNQAVIPLKPHKFGKMLIVPEGNLVRKEIKDRDVVYVHTDQIYAHEEDFNNIIENIISIKELKYNPVSGEDINLNEKLKYRKKRMRDFIKALRRFLKN